MSDFEDLLREVMTLKRQLAETRFLVANQVKVGTVEKIDAEKGYRLKYGEDGDKKAVLSPWYPHPEAGGALKSWLPLTQGQTVASINPGGDSRQGFLVRGGFSDQNKAPSSDTSENAITFGPYRISLTNGLLSIKGGPVRIEAGGVVHTISGSGVTTTGGSIRHDNKSIGSDHKHGGVMAGGSITNVPT